MPSTLLTKQLTPEGLRQLRLIPRAQVRALDRLADLLACGTEDGLRASRMQHAVDTEGTREQQRLRSAALSACVDGAAHEESLKPKPLNPKP